MSMRQRVRAGCDCGVHSLLVAVFLLVLLTRAAEAQTKRILLVGDSWAEYAWDDNAWPAVLSTYGLSQWGAEGSTTAIGGTTASVWKDPGALALVQQALAANPTIDIIHLSLGGNDMLAGQAAGGWHTGLSPTEESALFDRIQNDLTTVVDFCLGLRSDMKVGLIDYDYVNLWETSLAGIQGAQLMQVNLGNPSPSQVNAAFTNMGLRKRAIASSRSRVLYVHNWGLQQYRHGHPGFIDAGFVYRAPFAAGTAPFPGWPPAYSPYPGGNPVYPGPRAGMAADGDDPIHLNVTGYKDLCASALGQGFAGWLVDITGPTVLSITRKAGAQNPTTNQTLEFTVTFSEDVRTVA
ncbi:MAG: SGNH/GDSL hydrolase family protein, partial [Candidatus Hydrogenedentes bacterium]|nr:SGNH/GDSL hydrolase family protein [Candidatus Hydrogenedentota bacterium]